MADGERPDVAAVLAGLKPFQRDTVEHVFERLYGDNGGSRRFLVSDEVGLGKTLVARGVIARAIEHLWPKLPDIDRIDIVYICSNGAIARQNINRLNVVGEEAAVHASRVTLLPVQLHGLRERSVNFVSFTPGTSFDLRSSMGMWWERVVVYWMLREAWGFGNGAGPKNLFRGGVAYESRAWFREQLDKFPKNNPLDEGLLRQFCDALKAGQRTDRAAGRKDIKQRFENLIDRFGRARKHIPVADARARSQFIGEVRALLAESCIKALEPDLVILDEFQRFKHLLSDDTDAGRLAKELLEYSDANSEVRVLLLSATPYKMYTLHAEAGTEDHYRDFLHTLNFLLRDGDNTKRVADLLHRFRREVYLVAGEDTERLRSVKADLEAELSRVIARTERLPSTADGSGMVHETAAPLPKLSVRELCDYPTLQRLSDVLDAGSILEYWKSSPYLLNFMQGYKVKQQLKKRTKAEVFDPEVADAVSAAQRTLLSWRDLESYRAVDPGNVRLRALIDDTLERNWWRLLWVPPAMPYYQSEGAYHGVSSGDVTKRLVFSSWAVVPRTLAVILSYESERRRFCSFEETPENTPEARKRRTPLLQFAVSEGRRTGMPVLCLVYPSIQLARCGDVRSVAWVHGTNGLPELQTVLETVEARLAPELEALMDRYGATEGPVDDRWYWVAPMLLDRAKHRGDTDSWFDQKELIDLWSARIWDDDDNRADTRWGEHVEAALLLARDPSDLGRPPDDLLELLAEMAVAAPAVCALRSLARVSGDMRLTCDVGVRTAAAQVGWAFRSLFNRPSVIAMVRGIYEQSDLPYWRQVVRYCADGVLQSVLAEYAHVLRDALGVRDHPPADAAIEMAREMAAALTMRTVTIGVDEVQPSADQVLINGRRMRISFAMPFGDHRDESQREGVRQEQVRVAFNSPFRPFILATTSVGQEGLDFHQYCHAVVHWNLPSNPVDLEQREGRVHRYKCHAVRKNLAAVYRDRLSELGATDPWEELFQVAEHEIADHYDGMVPYWVFDPPGGCCIERHIPAVPFSKEVQRYGDLRRSLAVYRMVFGQPRQEDLLAYLVERVPAERLEELRPLLQINLRPRPVQVR
jgi:hypothetical protein